MAVTLATTPEDRLSLGYNGTGSGVCGYNGQPYDASSNPGGMDGNGVSVNWINMCADMVALGISAAQQAQMVTSYLAGSNGWVQETGAVSRLSATQFTVSGIDKTSIYSAGRAISALQTASAKGYILASSYAANLTTVTVVGLTLDAGLSKIWLGQEVANAPKPYVSSPLASQIFG